MSRLIISEHMLQAYQSMIQGLSRFGMDDEENKIDTAAIIISLTMYTFSHKDSYRQNVISQCKQFVLLAFQSHNFDAIKKRMAFYLEFINGKQPYGSWLFGSDRYGRHSDVLRAQAAYGDILLDPYARDDYSQCRYIEFDQFSHRFIVALHEEITGALNLMLMKYKNMLSNKRFSLKSVILIALAIIVVCFVINSLSDRGEDNANTSKSSATQRTSVSSTASVADYYKETYPATWAYISKYAQYPSTYVILYDRFWGDLQQYHGDGIPFDTLSGYEQSLIHYPTKGAQIYFATSTSTTYHATGACYTLLRSDPITRSSSLAYKYSPCSKCVGD